jgi:transcriptional regulator with XRE-family HTH domain
MGRPGNALRPRRGVLENLAANVRNWRTVRGLSQEALAEAAGLPARAVRRMETAEVESGIAAVAVIARALEVPVDALLSPAKFEKLKRGRPRRTEPDRGARIAAQERKRR